MRSRTVLEREVLRLPLSDWASVALPLGISVALALGGNAARALLRYEREAAATLSEPWRLLTAHVVHMNPSHLLLDGVALVLIWSLFVGTLPARAWWAAFFVGALAIDVGLYHWQPQIDWYVGLSGVEHSLFVAGALWCLLLGRRGQGGLMLLGLLAKLAWEVTVGPMPWSTSASRGPVVEAAHLYGTIGGAVALGAFLAADETCRTRLSSRWFRT